MYWCDKYNGTAVIWEYTGHFRLTTISETTRTVQRISDPGVRRGIKSRQSCHACIIT